VRLTNGAQADLRVPKHAVGTGLHTYRLAGAQCRLRRSLRKRAQPERVCYQREKDGGNSVREEPECTCAGCAFVRGAARGPGEFERDIPALLTMDDLQGDLQMHTTWSDGKTSVEEWPALPFARLSLHLLRTTSIAVWRRPHAGTGRRQRERLTP